MRKKDQRDSRVVGRVLCFSLCAPDVFLTFRLHHISQVVCSIFFFFPSLQFKTPELLSFPTFLLPLSAKCWATLETLGHLATLRMTSHPDTSDPRRKLLTRFPPELLWLLSAVAY